MVTRTALWHDVARTHTRTHSRRDGQADRRRAPPARPHAQTPADDSADRPTQSPALTDMTAHGEPRPELLPREEEAGQRPLEAERAGGRSHLRRRGPLRSRPLAAEEQGLRAAADASRFILPGVTVV